MPTANPSPNKLKSRHHYLRTPLASLLGSLAATLIILSIVVLWLGRTLTDTSTYVATVAPLVANNDVQTFTINKVSESLLDSGQAGEDGTLQGIASQLLGAQQIQGKTNDQLRAEVRPQVDETIKQVVTSPQFAQLWGDTNKLVHETLIKQLNNDSDAITLDFQPLINGVITQLKGTELAFAQDKVSLQPGTAVITVQSDKFENMRRIYENVKKAILLLVGLTIVMTIMAVAVSVHHAKTLRRVALTVGLLAMSLAVGLSATSLVKFSGSDAEQQKLILAIVSGVTKQLRMTLFVVAFATISASLGSKFLEVLHSKQRAVK